MPGGMSRRAEDEQGPPGRGKSLHRDDTVEWLAFFGDFRKDNIVAGGVENR